MTTHGAKDIHSGHRLAVVESMLWQGSPHWKGLALGLFHVRLVCGYFVLLAVLAVTRKMSILSALPPLLAAALFCGLLCLLSSLIARSTHYIVTDRRVILRYGLGLPRSLSLPFRQIASMAVFVGPDGRGDISLSLRSGNRVAYLKLWPHARGWQLTQPQPMLRNVPAAGAVATLLARALSYAEIMHGAAQRKTETTQSVASAVNSQDIPRDGSCTKQSVDLSVPAL